MTRNRKIAIPALITALVAAPLVPLVLSAAPDRTAQPARVTVVYEHVLPNVPGKSIKGVLVEYEPGASSPAHTHAPSAFIYATVLEGSIRSAVNNGSAKVYRAGENFTELPGDQHSVSANASTTERARLLAVFVVNTNETQLTLPAKH